MKKIIYNSAFAVAIFFSSSSFGQLSEEKDVTITMDLQPILQLHMSTTDQLEFIFDDIKDYYAGITRYAATVLKVSSSVSWDLYAQGLSNGNNGARFWDQQIQYGTSANGTDDIPLSCIELHQIPANLGGMGGTGGQIDYSTQFSAAQGGANSDNSLYVNGAVQTPPPVTSRYIAGHNGTTAIGTNSMASGSYLTTPDVSTGGYIYTIDYRIIPGLPAIFPNSFNVMLAAPTPEDIITNGGNYASPGVYSMHVKYVLIEDQ